ncbi:MAG: hypothetical protein KDD83_04335 [Caldilineaceae bacterium]|nr:hypothetical protein [Caldilineaceae bacterium]
MAKFGPPDSELRISLNQFGLYEREIRFYQELADQVAFRTPDCCYSAWDAETGEFVLLLEDLAPARNGERAVGCSLLEAEPAIREIAKFHAAWSQDPTYSSRSGCAISAPPLSINDGKIWRWCNRLSCSRR